jgi:hypothetical protein
MIILSRAAESMELPPTWWSSSRVDEDPAESIELSRARWSSGQVVGAHPSSHPQLPQRTGCPSLGRLIFWNGTGHPSLANLPDGHSHTIHCGDSSHRTLLDDLALTDSRNPSRRSFPRASCPEEDKHTHRHSLFLGGENGTPRKRGTRRTTGSTRGFSLYRRKWRLWMKFRGTPFSKTTYLTGPLFFRSSIDVRKIWESISIARNIKLALSTISRGRRYFSHPSLRRFRLRRRDRANSSHRSGRLDRTNQTIAFLVYAQSQY